MFYIKNSESDIVGASLYGLHRDIACYLYGVTAKDSRERYSGSWLLWESFKILQKQGFKKIDMEGVNSPQRGWFKLSFSGSLDPYYSVTWEGNPS